MASSLFVVESARGSGQLFCSLQMSYPSFVNLCCRLYGQEASNSKLCFFTGVSNGSNSFIGRVVSPFRASGTRYVSPLSSFGARARCLYIQRQMLHSC